MAKAVLQDFLAGLTGQVSPDGTIMRQKHFRAPNGAILSSGKHEAFVVMNPRNYKKKPPKGQELANINAFAQASHLAKLIINSGSYTPEQLAAMPDAERAKQESYRAQLADFQKRFHAQIETPDPLAPLLPKTDPNYNYNSSKPQRRQYLTLVTFIRAMLIQQAKTN